MAWLRGVAARASARLVPLGARLRDRFGFGTRRGIANATVAVSLLCALVSLLRGQDANWDLRNYHVHNAWALLQGRLGSDLAPAQMQSYFVPLLDVPYFLLVQHAPAPMAGVLLGLLHGLAFLPVAWIAWRALEVVSATARPAGNSRRTWAGGTTSFISTMRRSSVSGLFAGGVRASVMRSITVDDLAAAAGADVVFSRVPHLDAHVFLEVTAAFAHGFARGSARAVGDGEQVVLVEIFRDLFI